MIRTQFEQHKHVHLTKTTLRQFLADCDKQFNAVQDYRANLVVESFGTLYTWSAGTRSFYFVCDMADKMQSAV